MTDKPVFTDPFYVDKFMEIQQQNIVLYKILLKIKEDPELYKNVIDKFGDDIFKILEKCPA
jgi:hypothetical protein